MDEVPTAPLVFDEPVDVPFPGIPVHDGLQSGSKFI